MFRNSLQMVIVPAGVGVQLCGTEPLLWKKMFSLPILKPQLAKIFDSKRLEKIPCSVDEPATHA